jgi:hypothetical protein
LSTGSFSIETWVKSNAANGNKQTIFQKACTSTADGYDLKLVNNFISLTEMEVLSHQLPINTDRWYHVAVTFNKLQTILMEYQYKVLFLALIYREHCKLPFGAMDQ